MFFVDKIPHLKIQRQKVLLPVDPKIQSMHTMVFIDNATTESSIELINNPKISNNGRFHNYYIDNIYNGKFFGHNYHQIMTKDRISIYEQVEAKVSNLTTHNTPLPIGGRNLYYDLYFYNTIFFKLARRATTFRIKSEEYLKFLKTTLNDSRFSNYTNKLLFIDVDSWSTTLKKSIKGNKFYENPIFLIYFAMFKDFDKFKELGDINIIFYSEGSTLRLNPALSERKSYILLRNELAKLSGNNFVIEEDDKVDEMLNKSEVYNQVVKHFVDKYNFTGDDDSDELEDKIKGRLDEIEEEDSEVKQLEGKELEDSLTSKIINDEKILKEISSIAIENKTGKSTISMKRDQVLRDKQKELKMENNTIDDMQKLIDRKAPIESFDVSDKVSTTNKNVTTIRYPHFEKAYNEKLLKQDMLNTFTSLNDKSIPIFIRKMEVVDTSDELNFKETHTINLEDGNRVRHTLKFDMPKFIDHKFMYLNGNKKIIVRQLFMKPVIKTGPDEVQICSNYNKIFIRRYGNKISSKIEKFKKAIPSIPVASGFSVKYGNNSSVNNKYKTTVEYDELGKEYTSIRVKNTEFMFNQDDVQKLVTERKIKLKDNELCIGFIANKDPIIIDSDSQVFGDNMDIIDYILSVEGGKLVQDAYGDATAGKKFVYSRATIMSKQVPLVLLLSYLEGLSTVLRKASIKHYFVDKRPKDLPDNQGTVQFSNGYLVYDKYPFENSLLMNAFADIPTKGFTYEEFDDKEIYLTIFDVMFGTKIIGNAFGNFYELMIDPITKEVLEDLHYPTEFVNLVLFANAMLADNSYIKENDMHLYRVRSNELVNAYLYKAVATAYINYRLTANNNNPVKMSVPRDVVTKQILMAQTVEDYSTLNPIVELEKSRAITPKGHSGLNLDQAYTQDKRAYDPSMLGIIAMSTSPDANVGVVRQLTLEPNILTARGYIDIRNDDLDSLKDVNLFSPAELLSPLGVTMDDSSRTAMATKQSKHIIPVEKSSPVLISNGVEQIIPYHLSNDFAVTAKYDGEVVEVDLKTGIIMVAYYEEEKKKAPGGKRLIKEYQAIDTSPRIVKNGAGGFYLSNKLAVDLKNGQKFKKSDILASDEKFFNRSKALGTRFNIGSLQKVACMSSYSTYEDSTFITKKLSEDMASDIVMMKTVVLGKNASVDYLVKAGDTVTVGDDLIRFEQSFDDESLNTFLGTVGDALKEEIKSLGKTPVKSKYSGVIEDVRIYSTVDMEELSPSIQKIATTYYNRINKRNMLLNKYDKTKTSYKCGIILSEPIGKIDSKDGKLKGNDVGEGILIEIYIKYRDVMGIGDKLAFFTALKSINGEVIPEGYEPYSMFRPEEEVSSFIAPGAVLARMTPSILLTGFGNKVIIELKRSLEEIYTGKPWTPKK